MDLEAKRKRQSLRIIISEAIMVLAVIITVVVLAFIVSGYWINSDFEVERQGMLQISSTPSGASVDIDGDIPWLQRTNTSKVLTSGEHTITLTKEGYDSWSKTVNIKEGLLYRLHYPRLFLNDRSSEKVFSATGSVLGIISSNHNSLLITNNTTKWNYLKLNSEKIDSKTLDIAKYFSNVSLTEDASAGLFNGEILDADWNYDANRILFKVKQADNIEWVLIDVNNIEKSINLTKEFGVNFSKVEIIDNAANNLLAVQNGNLHKIEVPGRSISAILVEKILDFDHYNNDIVFSAQRTSKDKIDYYIGFFRVGENQIKKLEFFDDPVRVLISKFYDEKNIIVLKDNIISVHKKERYQDEYTNYQLSFTPEHNEVGHDGEFIFMYSGNNIATLDMEADLVREWTIENAIFDWIDNDMLYTVSEGELIVYDFDGYNRRVIAKNVSSHFPIGITDNKWLYYFSDDQLVREWLIEH